MYIFEGHILHADMYHMFFINRPNIEKRGHVMYYCNGMLYHAQVEGNTHFKEMRHYFQEFANPKGEKWQRVRSWHLRKNTTLTPPKKTRLHTPREEDAESWVLSCVFFVWVLYAVKREETAKVRRCECTEQAKLLQVYEQKKDSQSVPL